DRPIEPDAVERELVQTHRGQPDRGLILENARNGGSAARRADRAVVPHALAKQELTSFARQFPVYMTAEGARSLGQRAYHQPVPPREHLVVARRPHPPLAKSV